MKINNHEPITKRNDVNTDKYSTLLILKTLTDMIFYVSFAIFLKINIKKFINIFIDTLFK